MFETSLHCFDFTLTLAATVEMPNGTRMDRGRTMGRAVNSSRIGAMFSIAFLSAGCSAVAPAFRDETQLTTSAVVRGIQCEMKAAVHDAMQGGQRPWLREWDAAYALTLNMTETGSVAAIGQTPVTAPAVLVAIGAGGNVSETRRRIAKLTFAATVAEISAFRCEGLPTTRDHPFVSGRELGMTGLSDWLNRALDAADPAGDENDPAPGNRRPVSVGHTFEFVIEANVNASTGFTLLPAGGASFGPSLAVGRIDNHSLDVTFAPSKVSVRKLKVPEKVSVAGRPPTPEEATKLEALRADEAKLTAEINAPTPSILGLDPLSPTTQLRAKMELRKRLARKKREISLIEAPQKSSVQIRQRTETIIETSPLNAQGALQQLQIERLLPIRRF